MICVRTRALRPNEDETGSSGLDEDYENSGSASPTTRGASSTNNNPNNTILQRRTVGQARNVGGNARTSAEDERGDERANTNENADEKTSLLKS